MAIGGTNGSGSFAAKMRPNYVLLQLASLVKETFTLLDSENEDSASIYAATCSNTKSIFTTVSYSDAVMHINDDEFGIEADHKAWVAIGRELGKKYGPMTHAYWANEKRLAAIAGGMDEDEAAAVGQAWIDMMYNNASELGKKYGPMKHAY
jgi:hypothetical protein